MIKFISEPYKSFAGHTIGSRITFEIPNQDASMHELIEQFQYFLIGCGYAIDSDQQLMVVDAEDKCENYDDEGEDLSGVTRVEVIDEISRAYVNHKVKFVAIDVQDEGRTLKIFVQERV